MPCHICEVTKQKLYRFYMDCIISWDKNEDFLHECLQEGGVASQSLKLASECLLQPSEAIPVHFPSAYIQSTVDVHSIFRFEPMHNLLLRISPMLKGMPIEHAMLRQPNHECDGNTFRNFQWNQSCESHISFPFSIKIYMTFTTHL